MSADLNQDQLKMVAEQIAKQTDDPAPDISDVEAWLDTLTEVHWGSYTHVGLAYKYLHQEFWWEDQQ